MNVIQKAIGTYLLGGLAFTAANKGFAQVAAAGSGARGQFTQSLPFNGGAPLLSSFNFDYGFGTDHHFRTMSILPSGNNVTVNYSDKNGDDAYSWRIAFNTVNDARIIQRSISGSCRYACKTPFQVPAGYAFAIRGFRVEFLNDDHHVKTVGIQQGGTELDVWLSDINGDDQFSYEVRYALIPIDLLAESGTLSGTGVSFAEGMANTGRSIIRGFMFNFTNDDHHISQIGIVPTVGKIRMNYRDQNGDDSFSWRVLWSRLR